jgi:hypothetical protein
VHGFSDSCKAFTSTDPVDPGSSATSTVEYLAEHGYAANDIRTVGYYDPAHRWSSNFPSKGPQIDSDAPADHPVSGNPSDCDTNVRSNSVSGGTHRAGSHHPV